MLINRRKLAAAVLAPVAALLAQSQPSPSPAQGQPPRDDLAAARQRVAANAATLARFDVCMATEPAFRFEA
jgi:hypothetical protein